MSRCWYGLTGKLGGCECHPVALADLWWLKTEDKPMNAKAMKTWNITIRVDAPILWTIDDVASLFDAALTTAPKEIDGIEIADMVEGEVYSTKEG